MRATKTDEKIFEATSSKHIPRLVLHNDNSTFFGSSTKRTISHASH
jgi:hypothetical protein